MAPAVFAVAVYMAPEAAKSARALDATADVFAFGILAYEVLTGRSPFDVPAFLLALAGQPVPTPPPIDDARVPDAVRGLVLECLRPVPRERPRMQAVLTALR